MAAFAVTAAVAVPRAWGACDLRLRVSGEPGAFWHGGRDTWGQLYRMGTRCPHYSIGPNGKDEEGEGDDVALLDFAEPRLRLYRESDELAGLAALGVGVLLVLLAESRQLRARGRLLLPLLGAAAAVAVGYAAGRALTIVEPGALQGYALPSVLGTAALGGGIWGLALALPRGEPN